MDSSASRHTGNKRMDADRRTNPLLLSAFPAKSIEVTEGGHSQRLLRTGTEAEHWLTKEDLQRGRDTQRTVGGAVGEQYEETKSMLLNRKLSGFYSHFVHMSIT